MNLKDKSVWLAHKMGILRGFQSQFATGLRVQEQLTGLSLPALHSHPQVLLVPSDRWAGASSFLPLRILPTFTPSSASIHSPVRLSSIHQASYAAAGQGTSSPRWTGS